LGNIEAYYNGPGYRCDQWSDFVDKAIQSVKPRKYFKFYQEISWGLATNHSWTSVFGPCNQTQDKPDFSIDFWHYGGYNNDYSFTWKIRVTHTRLD